MASYVYFKCFNEMMFLNNNEKKKKANAISYEIDEFIWGRKDFALQIVPMARKADTPMPLIRSVIWVATLANGR